MERPRQPFLTTVFFLSEPVAAISRWYNVDKYPDRKLFPILIDGEQDALWWVADHYRPRSECN